MSAIAREKTSEMSRWGTKVPASIIIINNNNNNNNKMITMIATGICFSHFFKRNGGVSVLARCPQGESRMK